MSRKGIIFSEAHKKRLRENHKGMSGKKHSEKTKKKISELLKGKCRSEEIKKKISESHKGKILSSQHKNKLSISHLGIKRFPHTEETKEKISKSLKGRICSEEHVKNMRTSRITNIQRDKFNGNQMYPAYNPDACKLIDEYGNTNGYNFQHAENGGEHHIKELGYWVDGYDKKRNVVIEVDEKKHFDRKGNLKEKDVMRQKEIQSHLNCEFIRIKI